MKAYFLSAMSDRIDPFPTSIGPVIQMSVRLSLSQSGDGQRIEVPDGAKSLNIFDIRAQLRYVQTKGPELFLAEGFPYAWSSGDLHFEGYPTAFALLFPLRSDQIARIEDLRGGGKIKLHAFISVTAVSKLPLEFIPIPQMEIRSVNQQIIEVEKSKWVEEILPGLGWGTWKVFEIPFSDAKGNMAEIDELLNDAQKQFGLGNWADCLTASRKAVEGLQPYAKEFVNQVHSDDRGGTATEKMHELEKEFQNLATSMLNFQASVRKMLAAGAHKPPQGSSVERADAELGLMIVVALRRYVGLRMSR